MARGRPLKYSARLIAHPVEGMNEVINNLNAEIKKVKGGCNRGLVMFALHMRRVTELKEPFTPRDTGNLIASWFIAAADGLQADPFGKSGNFKRGRKFHITAAELRGQYNAITAASLAETRARKDPNVIFGYTANYAWAVHENVTIKEENWTREGSDAKWLEKHLNNEYDTILKIVRDNAEIK
jgi:hypothetical protein